MLSEGVTDVTLANAGWTCDPARQRANTCAPPGTGIPPIPPAADGQPTYNIMAFTFDHQFVHHVKLLRPDAVSWRTIASAVIPGHTSTSSTTTSASSRAEASRVLGSQVCADVGTGTDGLADIGASC